MLKNPLCLLNIKIFYYGSHSYTKIKLILQELGTDEQTQSPLCANFEAHFLLLPKLKQFYNQQVCYLPLFLFSVLKE